MERRKFLRVNFSGDVHCKIWILREDNNLSTLLSDKKKFKKVDKKNISCSGICLITEEKISPGSILLINIKFSNISHPIFAVGEVVWSRRVEDRFEAGVKFLKIADEDYFKISEFTIGKVLGEIKE